MEVPFNQPQSIEDKFNRGPGTIPDTPEFSKMQVPQQQFQSREELTQFLEEMLPLMRLQNEYDKLTVEQLEYDVMLNRRPIEQIPGLLGLEMKIRQIQALGFLGQVKQQQDEIEKAQKEAEEKINSQETIQ